MKSYISMLRGINVGGKNKIQMADLQSLYEKLKFKNVLTYIQSGNVIFTVDKGDSNINPAEKIEKAIYAQFGFVVPVISRSVEEMKSVISVNPFLHKSHIKTEKLHVTFLSENPARQKIDGMKNIDYSPDEFFIKGREVYLHCPGGYGKTKLSNSFFEKKLGVKTTTRNWNTVATLVDLAIHGEGDRSHG